MLWGCCGAGQGLAPAQQPQPASTKKEKSRELTAALRNACASVHSAQLCVCWGAAGIHWVIPPAAAAPRWGVASHPQHLLRRGPSALVWPHPITVLGQGIPCSSLALHMPGSCRWTGCPCLAMLQLLFLAGDQAPRSHDSVGLGLAKYTAHPSSMTCQTRVRHFTSWPHLELVLRGSVPPLFSTPCWWGLAEWC